MALAIKAEVSEASAKTVTFTGQKTMYGGKGAAKGDVVFVFASENEGGQVSSPWAWSLPPKQFPGNQGSSARRHG